VTPTESSRAPGTPFAKHRGMSISSWLAVSIVALTGCGTFISETPVNRPPRLLSPRPAETVEIFTSSPPVTPHVDVALLEVEQTHGLNARGTAIMLTSLRERAGELGCDAVFIGGFSEHTGAPPGDGLHLLDPGSTKLHATCIAYTARAVSAEHEAASASATAAQRPTVFRPAPSPPARPVRFCASAFSPDDCS
jgi:hypothetical protein